jgi:predicted PurR-regulated permease PerM
MHPRREPGDVLLKSDLARTTFQLLALGALIASSFWIVRPFLMASAWATMIVVATWPLLLAVERVLGGRRAAVAVLTVALLLTLLLPFVFGVTTVVEQAGRVVEWSKSQSTFAVPEPPAWVAGLPLVGQSLAERWQAVAAASPEEIAQRVAPFAATAARWLGSQIGNVGLLLVQVLLTIGIVGILYARGEVAAGAAERLARRLAGSQGEEALGLAARAIRAVALGVIVTAIVQSGLVGIGLAVAGVPFVTVLVALVFVLSVAQLGPMLVLVPAAVWVYHTHGAAWGTGFVVWGVLCTLFDNVFRPLVIKRGADLPLLLIFSGVIGGLIAFGVIGLFVGPVVLAVGYTLLADWVADGEAGA